MSGARFEKIDPPLYPKPWRYRFVFSTSCGTDPWTVGAWCEERWGDDQNRFDVFSGFGDYYICVHIRDEQDAIEFRMHWC